MNEQIPEFNLINFCLDILRFRLLVLGLLSSNGRTKPVNSSLLKKENTGIQFGFFFFMSLYDFNDLKIISNKSLGGNNLAPEDSALGPTTVEHTS